MKRLDWFVADRNLSKEVAEFMRCVVWKTELNLKYNKQIQDCKDAIEKLEVLRGSIHEDTIPEQRKTYLARVAELELERDKAIEEQATFKLSEAAETMKKALKKNPAAADLAIYSFFKAYHLDINDTGLVSEILAAAGEKIDNRTIVNSRGTVTTAFNSTNCFKMVFAKAYEHMVFAGTIKPVDIPELMMDKYDDVRRKARREAAKKAKKSAK